MDSKLLLVSSLAAFLGAFAVALTPAVRRSNPPEFPKSLE